MITLQRTGFAPGSAQPRQRFGRDAAPTLLVLATMLCLLFASPAFSQNDDYTDNGKEQEQISENNPSERDRSYPLTGNKFWLSIVTLIFGLVVLCILILLFCKLKSKNFELISQVVITIVIITGATVLIISGYSNRDIAPAIALFGTIAGYFLGRCDTRLWESLLKRSNTDGDKVEKTS